MKIDRNNYEVWMIDYFDSKLSAAEKAGLMAFIEENPDIKAEFEQFETVVPEPEDVEFAEKKELKKPGVRTTQHIDEVNYEDFFTGYYENDLDESMRKEVLEFVALNPTFKDEFEFHSQLFSKADVDVAYDDKASLKRRPVVPVYWMVSSAAAVVIILFGLYQFLKPNINIIEPGQREQLTVNAIKPLERPDIVNPSITAELIPSEAFQIDRQLPENENNVNERLAFASVTNLHPATISNELNYPLIVTVPQSTLYDLDFLLADMNPSGQKSLFGRIIQNIAGKITGNNAPADDSQAEEAVNEPRFIKALGKSINVFNTLTGSDTELVKTYDKNGNLSGYYVEGESVNFHREINRQKTSE